MPDGSSSSELWLLRTYFGGDDAVWTALTEQARSTRSAVSGAALVLSSDRMQCHQRIHRVLIRLAARPEASDGLYVAIADEQTFARPDRMLLTIDCSAVTRNAERLPTKRMAPPSAFRLGIDGRSPNTEPSIGPARRPITKVIPARIDSERTVSDLEARVVDAIRASQRWRTQMTRDGSGG